MSAATHSQRRRRRARASLLLVCSPIFEPNNVMYFQQSGPLGALAWDKTRTLCALRRPKSRRPRSVAAPPPFPTSRLPAHLLCWAGERFSAPATPRWLSRERLTSRSKVCPSADLPRSLRGRSSLLSPTAGSMIGSTRRGAVLSSTNCWHPLPSLVEAPAKVEREVQQTFLRPETARKGAVLEKIGTVLEKIGTVLEKIGTVLEQESLPFLAVLPCMSGW